MTPLKCNVWQWRRTVVYVLLHDSVNVRVCSVHSLHHTGHIGSYKRLVHTRNSWVSVHTLYILFSLLGNFKVRLFFEIGSSLTLLVTSSVTLTGPTDYCYCRLKTPV